MPAQSAGFLPRRRPPSASAPPQQRAHTRIALGAAAARTSRVRTSQPGDAMRGRTASSIASALRLWNGATPAVRSRPAPRPQLTLYEYEASPWCRRVRETLCVLDLEADVRPCPRSTLRVEGAYSRTSVYKPEVREAGGRLLFPFLVDHTAGVALNQSATIVEHLWTAYGTDVVERPVVDRWLNGRPALDVERVVFEASLLPKLVDFMLLAAPSGARPWAHCGLFEAPVAKRPERPLLLHACEPEPGCRLVRELVWPNPNPNPNPNQVRAAG